MTATAAELGITADVVYQRAACLHETVSAAELGIVYQDMMPNDERKSRAAYYTPDKVAEFTARFSLQVGIDRIGADPEQVMRITALDPACGAGIMLVNTARFLAYTYASRLIGGQQPSGALVLAVMPRVILECIYGVDNDPVAVDLARLALSLETVGALAPAMLERHIVCDSVLDGPDHIPPALAGRQRLARTEETD